MSHFIESLPQGRMLSTELVDGTLTITGTQSADTIEFAAGKLVIQVHLNNDVFSFTTPQVRRIDIRTLSGDDRIVMGGV